MLARIRVAESDDHFLLVLCHTRATALKHFSGEAAALSAMRCWAGLIFCASSLWTPSRCCLAPASETSGYAPRLTRDSLPLKRYLRYQIREPPGLTSRYRPCESDSFTGLKEGFKLRIFGSFKDLWGALQNRTNLTPNLTTKLTACGRKTEYASGKIFTLTC